MQNWVLKTTSYEFVVVYHTILVSVNGVHDGFELKQCGIFMLFVQGIFKLIDSYVAIAVGIDLLEQNAQIMNLFLGDLGGDECHR